jgi:hypothetical protein
MEDTLDLLPSGMFAKLVSENSGKEFPGDF